ncbi:MAG: hypothetical protein JXA95_18095 [Spirochaetales bacterium]|nr:hypothetical protein [Spirochaetales bacterium]
MKEKKTNSSFDWSDKPDLSLIKINFDSIEYLVKRLETDTTNTEGICFNLFLNYCAFYEFMFQQYILFSLSMSDSEIYYDYFWDQLSKMNTIENYLIAMLKIYHIDSTKEKNNPSLEHLKVLFYIKDILTHPGYRKSEWKNSHTDDKTPEIKWKYVKSVLVKDFNTSTLKRVNDLLLNKEMCMTIYRVAKDAMISLSNEFYGKFASSHKEANIIKEISLPQK